MYICPICSKEFPTEEQVVKHCLSCWKESNPVHESKQALRTESVTRKASNDIMNFFASYERRNDGRNIGKNASYY